MKKILTMLLLISVGVGVLEAGNSLTQTQVSMLYVSIFNRASEGEGNVYWQNEGTMTEVANKMLATSDAKEYFGSAIEDNQAFIELIYKNTLNKTPEDDIEGILYWVNELKKGKSRGKVVSDLVNAVGLYKDSTDPATKTAYNQFVNRVEISDYTAQQIYGVPNNYKTQLGFDANLRVNSDPNSISFAKNIINNISSSNNPPKANAGTDQTINIGDSIVLDATGSSDSDGEIVSYKWENGSNIFTTTNAYSIFNPTGLLEGVNTFTLTVTDDDGATATDTVNIIVKGNTGGNDLPDIKK